MDISVRLVKLTRSADYDDWYNSVKGQARAYDIWKYMDDKHDGQPAEPEDPYTKDAIRRIYTDYEEDFERQIQLDLLKHQREKYRRFRNRKASMLSLIYQSLSEPLLTYITWHDSDGTLRDTMRLIALRIAPTKQERRQQINDDAKRRETYGAKSKPGRTHKR